MSVWNNNVAQNRTGGDVIGQIWFHVKIFYKPRLILNFLCLLGLGDKKNQESTYVKSKLTWNQIWPVIAETVTAQSVSNM